MLGQDHATSGGKPGTNITFIYNSYKKGYKPAKIARTRRSCHGGPCPMQKAIPFGMTFTVYSACF